MLLKRQILQRSPLARHVHSRLFRSCHNEAHFVSCALVVCHVVSSVSSRRTFGTLSRACSDTEVVMPSYSTVPQHTQQLRCGLETRFAIVVASSSRGVSNGFCSFAALCCWPIPCSEASPSPALTTAFASAIPTHKGSRTTQRPQRRRFLRPGHDLLNGLAGKAKAPSTR